MSRFFSPIEAVDLRLLGNRDYQKHDRMRLLSFSKYVYQDLSLSVIKAPIRERYAINKKTNTVDLPCNNLQLSSVSVEDRYGNEYPVYRNQGLIDKSDIVDIAASKNCACEHECGSSLCSTIKGYEAVVETLTDYMPDGQEISFECVSRKGVDDQGFFYEQKQYPKRIYEDGVWVNTILYTETNKLCEVEVDENGCVCDTEENLNKVCDACNISSVNSSLCCIGGTASEPPSDSCDTWIYRCSNKMDWFMTQCGCVPNYMTNIYNISELGNRLIFPANFGWDKVVVRRYKDNGMSEMTIPIVAIDVFIMGLMYWDVRFDDKKQQLASLYEVKYGRMKQGLIRELNRLRIAEYAMVVAPPRFYPSYITGQTNQYEGGRRY